MIFGSDCEKQKRASSEKFVYVMEAIAAVVARWMGNTRKLIKKSNKRERVSNFAAPSIVLNIFRSF